MRLFKSAIVGASLAITFGVLAYEVAPWIDAVSVYAIPGEMFLGLIPSKMVYWLVPEGGPLAAALSVPFAAGFWTVLLAGAHFGCISLKTRRNCR